MSLAAIHEDDAADRRHVPVMVEEVCGLLSAHGPLAFVDVTVGTGGHAEAMLRATKARMLGLDRDGAALGFARERLAQFGDRVVLERADFGEVAATMKHHGFEGADAMLADLGMSSYALDDPQRGFSFRLDGPLDMRVGGGVAAESEDDRRGAPAQSDRDDGRIARDRRARAGSAPTRRRASGDTHLPGASNRGESRAGKSRGTAARWPGDAESRRPDAGYFVSFARRPSGQGAFSRAGARRWLRGDCAKGDQ